LKTAKEFAQGAAVLTKLADDCKPQDPAGRYVNAENLIVYHLRSAATKAREIAEAKANEETARAPL